MTSFSISPSPRSYPFTASSKDLLYLYGGRDDTEPDAVYVYSVNTEGWTKKVTQGPHPPAGQYHGGCCIAGCYFYLYGGWVDSTVSGTLYQLNTDTWTWKELSNGSAKGGPGKKIGCRMVSYQDQVFVIGGHYGCNVTPESRQPGVRYECGYTNEVHGYCLSTGKKGYTLNIIFIVIWS